MECNGRDTIYLCGPINGRTDDDARGWREAAKARWRGRTIDPMRRDYRGREMDAGIASEIVEGDLQDIRECDAMLVWFDRPSIGTAMEVFFAASVLRIPVVVVDVSNSPLSPWLAYHATSVTKSMDAALAQIGTLLNRAGGA